MTFSRNYIILVLCTALEFTTSFHNMQAAKTSRRITNDIQTSYLPSTARQRLSSNSVLKLSSTDAAGSSTNERIPLKKGTVVALITPMDPATGNVNYNDLRSLLRYHLNAGTDNLCILGTTGEAAVLSKEEKIDVLKIAVEEVKGKMPILVGTGTIDPVKVKSDTLLAADLGCDAALVVTPYYVKPPQRGLIQHFTSIADLNSLPVVMYNVPGRTGVNLEDASAVIAAQHPNIVALKDATGNLERHANIQKLLKEQNLRSNLLLYSGDDGTTVDYVANGGDGCISVTANVAAKQLHDIVQAALRGNIDEAFALNKALALLHDKLFVEANPMPCKYAAARIGLISSAYARPPLDFMDSKFNSVVDDALRIAKLLE